MENNMELNMEQMSEVTGGKNEGGYAQKPAEKSGCFIYKVRHGDTLSKIANNNNTTVQKIMKVNPELKNANFIVTNCYIYIPN